MSWIGTSITLHATQMAMQSTKDSSVETVAAVAQTLETWGQTDVVLHAEGELATKSLVRAIADARVHRALPRHGPPYSHQSQGPVEASIQVFRKIFVAHKLALEAGIGCRLLLKQPAIVELIRQVAELMTRYNTGRDGCSPSWARHKMAASASVVNRCVRS